MAAAYTKGAISNIPLKLGWVFRRLQVRILISVQEWTVMIFSRTLYLIRVVAASGIHFLLMPVL
jgi:hypothetical protein